MVQGSDWSDPENLYTPHALEYISKEQIKSFSAFDLEGSRILQMNIFYTLYFPSLLEKWLPFMVLAPHVYLFNTEECTGLIKFIETSFKKTPDEGLLSNKLYRMSLTNKPHKLEKLYPETGWKKTNQVYKLEPRKLKEFYNHLNLVKVHLNKKEVLKRRLNLIYHEVFHVLKKPNKKMSQSSHSGPAKIIHLHKS